METALNFIFIIFSSAILSASAIKMLHMYQLSSYHLRGVFNWLRAGHYEYILRYFAFAFFGVGLTLLFNFCFPYENVHYFSFLIYVFLGVFFMIAAYGKRSKVPLAVTPRMTRLIMTHTVLCIGLSVGGWGLSLTPMGEAGYAVLPVLIPLTSLIAFALTYPMERSIARSFMRDAAEEVEKAKARGLKVIGITGSYGKTTAKNILTAMLSTKYRVCASPRSYNTPLGICRTVNDVLSEDDEFLVAEMGARRPGDIKEICEVARPDIAVITGVGDQHYETFGSREAIADTKYELVEALDEGGVAAFNGADEGALALSERFAGDKIVTCLGKEVYFTDLSFGKDGTRFTIHIGNESHEIKTRLLGRHIPALMCLCAAVAIRLGVPSCACVRACERMAPVPHRLELIVAGNKTILDDAYNSNPAGAANALEVLSAMSGSKVIVTPGMVELGALEEGANEQFGREIAGVCDKAILVGSRAKKIKAGCVAAGMDESKIFVVNTLAEASALVGKVTEEAAILFENDLPDNYK